MIDISATLEAVLNSDDAWIETEPAFADVVFSFDEFDPKNPKLQILFQNGPDTKTWVTKGVYRIEHQCLLTIFVRPVNYKPATITATKTTFLNLKSEVDRILMGVESSFLSGWKDVDFEVGRDTGLTRNSPIIFKAIQKVTSTYYGLFSTDPVEVTISIMKDGEHYGGGGAVIGTESYADGEVAHLSAGTISLGVNIPDDVFESWSVAGENITVDMPDEADTYLIVLGTGPDTLILTLQDSCPIGEQIVNGDFETGDFTGWTGDYDTDPDTGFVVSDLLTPPWEPYEGSYCVKTFASDKELNQTFASPIPYDCWDEDSVFQLYIKGDISFSPTYYDGVDIYILYDDTSETLVSARVSEYMVWTLINLKSYVEVGKTVVGIRIVSVVPMNSVWVDACTLIL